MTAPNKGGKASATFHATGLPDNVLSTRNFETCEKEQLDNSIVQIIKPSRDIRLDKIDLYFSTKDDLATNTENLGSTVDNRPVILQVRAVKDGKATNEILPFSTVIKEDISALTGNSATSFAFDEYLTLYKDVNYAITLISGGDYQLRVLDTYKNSGTRPAQFGSFWRGNKKYPKKALKMVLYNTQHEITQEHLALVSEPVPNIVLDKNAISTVAGTSYITVKLPGHGFRKDDSMYLSNIVGRKETMISIPTSGAASITVGDKVYKNGSTPNADGSYNGPWGYVINKGSASPVLLTVAMVSGIFVAAELLNGSAGGSGTINSVGGDLTGYDVRYFGGVKVNHADADSLEKVEWKVDSNGLTADEFRLTTSGISDLEFHRTSIINDS